MVESTASLAVPLRRDHGRITCTVELPRFTYADVKEDEPLGRLVFRCDVDGDGQAEALADVALTALYAVPKRERPGLWRRLWTCIADVVRKR